MNLSLTFDVSRFNPERPVARLRAGAWAAIQIFGEKIMTEAKILCPVDLGTLHASGHVRTLQAGNDFVLVLAFGGPAAPYAAIVHEDMTARHAVGQAKYLEVPVVQNKPQFAPFVASYIKSKAA